MSAGPTGDAAEADYELYYERCGIYSMRPMSFTYYEMLCGLWTL